MRVWLILVFCVVPALVAAGPWPRERGQIYALVSHQGDGDGYSSFYLEYGGPRDLTFGIVAGGHVVGLPELMRTGFTDRPVDGRVRAFVRYALPGGLPGGPRFDPWRAALELNLGRDYLADGQKHDRVGIAASVGRGFASRFGDGWTTLDLGVSTASGGDTRTNLGAVLGLKPRERLALELGLFAEHEREVDYQIGPTVQYDFGLLGQGRLGVAYKSGEDTVVTLGWARSF